jgi:hypothetical protein
MAASGATPIILYHSTTGAAVPSNTNLSPGELAVNIADMKLYCENDSGVVTLLSSADAAAGNFTTVDINGGTIDGAVIGGSTEPNLRLRGHSLHSNSNGCRFNSLYDCS